MIEIIIDGCSFLVDPKQESIRAITHIGLALYYFKEIEGLQVTTFKEYPFKKALARYRKLAAFHD